MRTVLIVANRYEAGQFPKRPDVDVVEVANYRAMEGRRIVAAWATPLARASSHYPFMLEIIQAATLSVGFSGQAKRVA